MELAPMARGREPEEERAAAWVAALVKDAAGAAWAGLAWDLAGIASARIAGRPQPIRWAFPVTRRSVRSVASR
jgi:hypothetical protein